MRQPRERGTSGSRVDYIKIVEWLFTTLVIGGALWKGLDSIANAFSARASAINADRRLYLEQEQANYNNAMALIEKQAERIDALHQDITSYENKWDKREMSYLDRIRALEDEVVKVRQEYKELLERHHKLECEYEVALLRIDKLEKRGTGPLP